MIAVVTLLRVLRECRSDGNKLAIVEVLSFCDRESA